MRKQKLREERKIGEKMNRKERMRQRDTDAERGWPVPGAPPS